MLCVRGGTELLALGRPFCVDTFERVDLRLAEIRRHVDVRRAQKLAQLGQLDEAVLEHDVLLDAQLPGQLVQPVAVGFSAVTPRVRVRGAQDHVDDVGKLLDHFRQGPNGVLDALARPQQAERQHDQPALDAELVLVERRVYERHVRDAVGDHDDLARVHSVDLVQEDLGQFGHHDHPGAEAAYLRHDAFLAAVRLLEDGVERRHQRAPEPLKHRQDVRAVATPEDPVLMLKTDHRRVGDVHEFGGPAVVGQGGLADLEADLVGIPISLRDVVDRGHAASVAVSGGPGHRVAQIVGERRDAALAGQVIGGEDDPRSVELAAL